jgi:hypothetical protein
MDHRRREDASRSRYRAWSPRWFRPAAGQGRSEKRLQRDSLRHVVHVWRYLSRNRRARCRAVGGQRDRNRSRDPERPPGPAGQRATLARLGQRRRRRAGAGSRDARSRGRDVRRCGSCGRKPPLVTECRPRRRAGQVSRQRNLNSPSPSPPERGSSSVLDATAHLAPFAISRGLFGRSPGGTTTVFARRGRPTEPARRCPRRQRDGLLTSDARSRETLPRQQLCSRRHP